MNPVRLLDNFPLIRTRSIEQARQALARIFAKPTLELDDHVRPLDVSINNYQLQDVGLTYATYGAAVRLGYLETDLFVECFPIRGKGKAIVGKTSLSLVPESGATISPHMHYQANFNADLEHLVLRINAEALTRKLAAITGATISAPLVMEPAPDFAQPVAQMLRHYIIFLVGELSTTTSPLPDWAQGEIAQLVMVMLLCSNRHNYSHLLEQKPLDVAPMQVRRAEEYIETNWNQPISLESLATVTGVSALSLLRSFKQTRGYSPMEFVKRVRLREQSKRC